MVSDKTKVCNKRRIRRKHIIRKRVTGTALKPRLSVYKSNKYIYIQAIDDDKGFTLASASSLIKNPKSRKLNKEIASKTGEVIGKKLAEKNIKEAVFDRNGFLYSGRIKALADGVRKTGLKF